MWWSRFRFRDRRINILLMAALIGLVVALLSDKKAGFGDSWVLLIIIFAALPAISSRRGRRYRNRWRDEKEEDAEEDLEKPKHDFEKPKREPRYVLGDDGEITEVTKEQPLDDTAYDDDKTLYV